MSDDLLTTIKVTVDSSGVATGVAGAKRSLQDLGKDVAAISAQASDAVKKMVGTDFLGPLQEGTERVSKSAEKATKAAINDTARLASELQKFGTAAFTGFSGISKSVEQAYIAMAGKGISTTYIDAYIDKLKEAQGVQRFMGQEAAKASQIAAQAVEAENQRLAHTLELKRQIASVKTTVDKNNAAAQAAQQAEAKAQHQMRLLALNNQIQASNKATADAQAAQSAKAIKDLKDLTAAQAAYRQEVINSELNFTHTGRGKSTAFLADKGQRLGFDSSFIEKELAGYKKVEDAAKAAFQAANPHIAEMSKRAADAGTSVKGLSASLRNVPAQFTDIVVSLQGGQAPLTVLLQQGGQLKDLFGGVGNAARALGGYVVGLINPFTVAAGVVGTLGLAYFKGAAEAEAYNSALINTGNAAGVTAGQLGNMAKAVAQATGGTVGAAAEALAGLAGTSGIAASQFEKIAAVAVQMEKVTGVAVADTVKQFAELGKDPVGASLKLTESTKYLTAEVYEQIRALVEQGKTVEAGTVAQNALADVMKKRIPELVDNLGYLESGWKNVAGAAKGAWDFMAGIGRPGPTMAQKIAEQIAELEQLTAPGRGIFAGRSKEQDKELANLRMQAEYWAGIEKSKADAAALDAARIKQEEASIRLSETAYKNEKDRTVLMERERAKVKADYEASKKSLRDTENYEKAIAQIKERYKEKAIATTKTKSGDEFASQREAAKEWAGYMERFGNMADKSTAEVDGLNKAQAELVKYLSSTAYTQMDEPARQLALQSAYAAIAIEQQADATKALNKAQEALEKERTSAIQSHVKEIDSINNKAQKLEDEVAAYGQSKEAIEALTTARMADQIKVLKGFDGSSEEIARIEKTIAARKRLAAAGAAKDQKDASKKAAEDAAKEWQKGWEETDRLARDVFVTWAEDGSNAAKKIGDTLEKALLSAIYEATIKPVAFQIYSSATSALGLPGSGGGAGGLLNTASNLNTLFGAGSQALFGASVGASSASLLGANAVGAVGGDALGALIAGNGGWAGVSVAAEAGAAAGAASGAAAATTAAGTSAAGALAAIPGWGWALGGALLLAGMMGGDNGPKLASTGDAIRRYDKGGALTENATNGAWFFTNTDDANKLLDGLESRYQKAAKALGIGTVATQFDYGSNNRGNFALAGAAGNSRANTGEIAYSPEAMQVAASRAVFAALQGSELPKYLSGLLDSVGDINALSQTQIDDLLNTAQAFKGLHDVMVQMPFDALHDLSYDAAKGLIEFSGGLDKLTQNLGTYYENFYSAEEKKAQTLKNITQTLTDAGALTRTTRTAIPGEHDLVYGPTGMSVSLEQRYATSVENLDMPKTREEFRALVDSFKELSGPHAQEAYAALMSVSGAFASVTPAAADAAAALEKDLAARATWQQKLDVLTGKTTEQQIERANDLAGVTDVATIKLIERVHAEQDLTAATAAATAAVEKAAAAQKAITTANQSIALSKATLAGASSQETAFTAADFALQNSIAALDAFKESLTKKEENVTTAEIESLNISDFAKTEFIDELSDLMTGYWSAKAGVKDAQDAIDQAAQQAQAQAEQAAREAAQQRAAAIGQERAGLQSQLDQLTMNSTQLLEKQRAALDESNRALFDNIQAQTAWKAISTQHADLQDRLNIANGTITARQAALQKELAGALDDTSASMIRAIYAAEDQSAANERAAAAAKEQADAAAAQAKQLADEAIARAKALAETNKGWRDQLDVLTGAQTERSIALRDALDGSTRALMRQVYAQQDLKSAVDNAVTNSDNALGGIQKALDAQKTAQTQAVNDVQGLFDLLSQSVKDLYAQVDSARAMQAAEGQAFISTALALYKAGGTLPDEKKLGEAITAARAGIDGAQYASQVDADFARLALAGQLSQLESAAGAKLTDAQALLETTNNAYETAKAQLDTLRGIDTRVLSVAEAVEAFQVAYTGESTARQKLAASIASAAQTGGDVGRGQFNPNYESDMRAYALVNLQSKRDQINLLSPIVGMGELVGQLQNEITAINTSLGVVPRLASGTNYVPQDMLARIHKGEAVVPAAFNPYNPNTQQGSAGNARLEALVEALTAEVQRLQAIVNDGNKQTRRTADAVNGNPEMPMLVETV